MSTLVSLFAGAGGLDLGFHQAGFTTLFANEKYRPAIETYRHNFPAVKLDPRSIQKLRLEDVPTTAGLIGGPPCQSWSVNGNHARKPRGIDDPRGQLFYEYIRLLQGKQPEFFVAENVKGITFRANQAALAGILQAFDTAGYNVVYRVLDASRYGVPQDRFRTFFIGYRKDLNKTFDFDKLTAVFPRPTLQETIKDLRYNAVIYGTAVPAVANHEYEDRSFSKMYLSRWRMRDWHEPGYTVTTADTTVPLHPDAFPRPVLRTHAKRYGFDLVPGGTYRRLTVREQARIQTFPDTFEFKYHNLAAGYLQVGNAVPPRLACQIATLIKHDLNYQELTWNS
jgi:DNA (cytosine-5)-methyltransferase 1